MRIHRRHARGRPPHPDVLTPAEWRVLHHLRESLSNAAIAERLGVSINTVRTHVSSMLAKLSLEDREALARWQGEPAETTPSPRAIPLLLTPLDWLQRSAAIASTPARVLAISAGSIAFVAIVWVALGSALEQSTTVATATPVTLALRDPELLTAGEDSFSIYLLNMPLHEAESQGLSDLSQLEPILAPDDILTYSADRHEIELADGVYERLDRLELPGKPFVVIVGGRPIYIGEFMALTMSRSSDRAVILWPLAGPDGPLHVQLGYPTADFFAVADPRSDSRILDALDTAGKLR